MSSTHVVSSRLHLDGIVAIAQLGQTKASDRGHVVDLGQQAAVSFSTQLDHRASEQVPLNSHLPTVARVNTWILWPTNIYKSFT